MKTVILYCRDINMTTLWRQACEKLAVDHECIDVSAHDWLSKIRSAHPDLVLLRPPGDVESDKIMFDERLYVISKVLRIKTFPTYEEILIYENKKMLSYILEAQGLPHPKTRVFYDKIEALDYVSHCDYPVVMKSSIGASGIGVLVMRDSKKAARYVHQAFSKRGVPMQIGPNRVIGSVGKWVRTALSDTARARDRISQYHRISVNRPKNFMITQEYIPHDFEWRVIVIGNSHYAYQKSKYKDKCSGTKSREYVDPPKAILNFASYVCREMRINSAAIDMFEHEGEYLINEIQAIFGYYPGYIMMEVNGIPGRYEYRDGEWIYIEGRSDSNESYEYRLELALKLYQEGNL